VTGLLLGLAFVLGGVGLGCARAPAAEIASPLPPVSAAPTHRPARTATSQEAAPIPWAALTRAGHQALRPRDYEAAEQQFLAALTATSAFATHDVRTRTSLGNLLRLASRYHAARRHGDERRVMDDIRGYLAARDFAPDEVADYEAHLRELTATTTRAPLFGPASPRQANRGAPRDRAFDRLIARTARRFGGDPALVKAVVAAESNFEVNAVSRVGAQGLMQLMPETAREMGVRRPFEPDDNLRGGVRYLREMLDRFGDTRLALAAYNAGPTAVDRYKGIPPYSETRAYVKRVLRFYDDYRGELTN